MPIRKASCGHLDRDLPVSNVKTLRETIEKSTIDSQFDSLLVLAFAVHRAGPHRCRRSLWSAHVSRHAAHVRTQGYAWHSGQDCVQLLRAVLFDGLRPALLGLVHIRTRSKRICGSPHQVVLYQTGALDPAVFTAVAALLLAVAILACLLPTSRASRLDPIQALRTLE